MAEPDYIQLNRDSWNRRTEIHYHSEFYDNDSFLAGRSSLNSIELDLLGDISGKKILHLQCHFGQDTISLSRMRAEAVGVDLSDKAISKATELAAETKQNTRFICCNVYDLSEHMEEEFDIVFTSYGTIGWLPDLDKWAAIVERFLTPGGSFVFVEFHPVVWMFDDDFQKVGYNYFNDGPIIENESGTYADRSADLHQQCVGWNHALEEVLSSLLNKKLVLKAFKEYDYSPYNCFAHTEEFEPGKFRIKHLANNIPMVYALKMTKPN